MRVYRKSVSSRPMSLRIRMVSEGVGWCRMAVGWLSDGIDIFWKSGWLSDGVGWWRMEADGDRIPNLNYRKAIGRLSDGACKNLNYRMVSGWWRMASDGVGRLRLKNLSNFVEICYRMVSGWCRMVSDGSGWFKPKNCIKFDYRMVFG